MYSRGPNFGRFCSTTRHFQDAKKDARLLKIRKIGIAPNDLTLHDLEHSTVKGTLIQQVLNPEAQTLVHFAQILVQSASQPASQSVSQPVTESVSQPASQPASQSVSQPASQLASQSVSQRVSQSVSQRASE